MASPFPSSGFFAGGSWTAERLTAATHTTATVSTGNIHLISGSSLQKRVYTTFARERATKRARAPIQRGKREIAEGPPSPSGRGPGEGSGFDESFHPHPAR